MCAQRAELPTLALSPIINDHFRHYVGEGELNGAHGAIRDDEGAPLDPFSLQHCCGLWQARGLHHDVSTLDAGMPVGRGLHGLAEILREPRGECVTAFRPARMNAD